MAGVYIVTSLLSTFISNSATAILVAPIAWAAAEGIGVNPTPFMMTAAVAAFLLLRHANLYAAQCDGDERGPLHLYGLRQGGSAVANHSRHRLPDHHSALLPVLR